MDDSPHCRASCGFARGAKRNCNTRAYKIAGFVVVWNLFHVRLFPARNPLRGTCLVISLFLFKHTFFPLKICRSVSLPPNTSFFDSTIPRTNKLFIPVRSLFSETGKIWVQIVVLWKMRGFSGLMITARSIAFKFLNNNIHVRILCDSIGLGKC